MPPPLTLKTPGGGEISGLNDTRDGKFKTISTASAYTSVLKAYLGSGLLALPFSFLCGGVIAGAVGLAVLAFISNCTLKMLVWMRRLLQKKAACDANVTYISIGSYALGRRGKFLATAAELCTNVGIAIGYLIFCGNTALEALGAKEDDEAEDQDLHNTWIDPGTGKLHLNLVIVACAVPLFLFAQLRSMRNMGWVSFAGNAAVALAVVAVSATSIYTIEWKHLLSSKNDIDWTLRLSKLPTFFGIAMFSFTIHGIVLPIEAAMQHPKDAYRMFDTCAIIVTLTYIAFGFLGYAAFQSDTAQSVLDNLPTTTTWKKTIAISVQLILVVAMLLTVPLFNFATIKTVEDMWFGEAVKSRWRDDIRRHRKVTADGGVVVICDDDDDDDDDEDETDSALQNVWCKRQALRLALVAGLVGFAILLGPLFSQVIAFVGAFSMSAIAFILPALFYLRICGAVGFKSRMPTNNGNDVFDLLAHDDKTYAPSRGNIAAAWAILIFGVIAMIGATAISVVGMVKYFAGDDSCSC
eukprot:g112.t1